MEKIASFQVDHTKFSVGMYISRIDGDIVTYDIRMVKPNGGVYISNPSLHTIEHLFATYARNSSVADKIIYVGPMGCRTGFYVIFKGDLKSENIVDVLRRMIDFVLNFEGTIPGASARDCGNYLDLNLSMAKYFAKKYKTEVLENLSAERMNYPE